MDILSSSIIIFLIVVILFLVYGLYNVDKKISFYEKHLTSMYDEIVDTFLILRSIDFNGAFESDDEVGVVFKKIYDIIKRFSYLDTQNVVSDIKQHRNKIYTETNDTDAELLDNLSTYLKQSVKNSI